MCAEDRCFREKASRPTAKDLVWAEQMSESESVRYPCLALTLMHTTKNSRLRSYIRTALAIELGFGTDKYCSGADAISLLAMAGPTLSLARRSCRSLIQMRHARSGLRRKRVLHCPFSFVTSIHLTTLGDVIQTLSSVYAMADYELSCRKAHLRPEPGLLTRDDRHRIVLTHLYVRDEYRYDILIGK